MRPYGTSFHFPQDLNGQRGNKLSKGNMYQAVETAGLGDKVMTGLSVLLLHIQCRTSLRNKARINTTNQVVDLLVISQGFYVALSRFRISQSAVFKEAERGFGPFPSS